MQLHRTVEHDETPASVSARPEADLADRYAWLSTPVDGKRNHGLKIKRSGGKTAKRKRSVRT